MRSFRRALALRVALQTLGVATVAVAGATLYLRAIFVSDVDRSLAEMAQLEAQHGVLNVLARHYWSQVVTPAGVSGERSLNLHEPLAVPPRALDAARQGGGRMVFATHRWKSQLVRSVVSPLPALPDSQPQFLQVATSLEPVQARLESYIWPLAALAMLLTAVSWLMAWLTASRALNAARSLTTEAESIGAHELNRRVTLPDLAEFNRMAAAFNALLDRLERAVTGTRRFTADASHELRAPLTVLRGELELALSRPRALPDYEEVLRRCLDEVLRLVRLADDLLTLTRIQGGVVGSKRSPVELDDVVERAIGRKAALAQSREVTVELLGTAGLVSGDADLLLRAVDGLVEHAIMASPKGGKVRVRLAADLRRSVEVTDGGPGLKAEEISGVFQRFYRSNRQRVSSAESGLGLPIARAVALSHGGALDYVGNDPGASFLMSLPPAE